MTLLTLTLKSLANRKFTVALTILSIAVSVMLLLGVERIRIGTKTSFQNTLSGTDLIVGARSGQIPLLLYSVFRIGNPTNNISWSSYQHFAQHPAVQWTIPLSLGDSHRGFRVLGTSKNYFTQYRYGYQRNLVLQQGTIFQDIFDVVLGSEVARQLEYQLGDQIVLNHGLMEVNFGGDHRDKPFKVAGILEKTGTAVDHTLHILLEGYTAIHVDWKNGVPPLPGQEIAKEAVYSMDLTPQTITAFLVGLRSKMVTFQLQRSINEYKREPLLAILPGITLQELWSLFRVAENALRSISIFVVITGLLGMLTMILTTLHERRREMAILRSVGAKPFHIFSLLVSEALLLSTLGVIFGVILLYAGLFSALPFLQKEYGLHIPIEFLSLYDGLLIGIILIVGFLIGCIPAWRAYRNSLADGLTIRL